jgi:hypothetical protein
MGEKILNGDEAETLELAGPLGREPGEFLEGSGQGVEGLGHLRGRPVIRARIG